MLRVTSDQRLDEGGLADLDGTVSVCAHRPVVWRAYLWRSNHANHQGWRFLWKPIDERDMEPFLLDIMRPSCLSLEATWVGEGMGFGVFGACGSLLLLFDLAVDLVDLLGHSAASW